MRQGSAKQVVSALKHKKTDVSYQTKVVGGVVQRVPIQVRLSVPCDLDSDFNAGLTVQLPQKGALVKV